MMEESLISFPLLNGFDNLTHFVSTRYNGISVGTYAAFNLSPFSGDAPECVAQNTEQLCGQLGIAAGNLVVPYQVHGTKVVVIEDDFVRWSAPEREAFVYGADALVTDVKGICLAVTTADCVPVLIYDRAKKAVAAVHAGWRGTCGRIVEKTIGAMRDRYGSDPADLFVLIGPSISGGVYEVGEGLMDDFNRQGFIVPMIFHSVENKLYLDLPKANRWLLTECGVPEGNIELSGICTYTEHERFFSARRLGIESGRMLSGIMMG